MCSVAADIEELGVAGCSENESFAREEKQLRPSNLCKKCGQAAVVVLQRKDPFCRSCFLAYCNHKFRSTIGKSKKIKTGSKVLVCHSGGSSSTAMLHMIVEALQDMSPKKLIIKPGILHIDETFLVSHNLINKSEMLGTISNEAQTLGCPTLFSSLEMAIREDDSAEFYWDSADETGNINTSLRENVAYCVKSIRTLSSKQEYVEHLRMQLITDIAKHAGYSYIFVGDSATYLAVRVLSDIAVGRGSQVSCNTSFFDPHRSVPVCRPMREFLNKELVFYNQLNNLRYQVFPSLLTMTHVHSSIQRITEAFVLDLQDNFPATVFTIYRTGGKVAAKANDSLQKQCLLCECIQDNSSPSPCSAVEAMALSVKLSRTSPSEQEYDGNHSEKNLKEVIKHHLCHGCQVLVSEMGNFCFPHSVMKEVTKLKSRTGMKEEISEFLLNDGEE